MEYDARGRVVRQINAEGGVTSFTYTDAGQLKTLTDPVGNTTSYEYDDQNRPVKETNELGKSRLFEYLAGKMMAKKTDRNGRVIMFEHDDFSRVVAEKWFEADKVVKTLAFEYNALGHLTKVDDGTAVFDYARDEEGRELAATMTLPGLENPIVQQTEYDVLGRRTQIATAFGGQVEFSNLYTYTKTGQVESILQDGKRVNYHYDAAGMRSVTQLFSQGNEVITTSQTYDDLGRLTQIKHGDMAQYDYAWDIANRITAMNDANYDYDNTSQLTSAEYDTLPKELYEYDANGNRKAYETGKNNQLLSDGVFEYKYDDEGNRVEKRSKDSLTRYEWDHHNRLVRVLDNGKSVEYDYDYQNRLVRRNDELFVHDGWQVACSLKNGRIAHCYLWGAVQDELLAMDDAWTLRDHLNTVRKVVDMNGKVVSHLEYNAFGKLVSATGGKPLFRYTGKMFDDATGLQWNINRWYDANVGRWISEDPIGFRGKDANLYSFLRNKAVFSVDPLGLVDDSGFLLQDAVISMGISGTRTKKVVLANQVFLLPKTYTVSGVGDGYDAPLGKTQPFIFEGYVLCKCGQNDNKWKPEFYINGGAVAIVAELSTCTYDFWNSALDTEKAQYGTDHPEIMTISTDQFVQYVINHENNHVFFHRLAHTIIRDNLALYETTPGSWYSTRGECEEAAKQQIANATRIYNVASAMSSLLDNLTVSKEDRYDSFIDVPFRDDITIWLEE